MINSWNDVTKLHVEISQRCNAACPQCARHPTASYFVSPSLNDNVFWTLEQVRKYLPEEDLTNIEKIHYNGTRGDWITNPQALEITRYFRELNIYSTINTNGSARKPEWWAELGRMGRLKVNFAIDGLKDTNHLYRRRTDFDTIMANAQAFIDAGGEAEWHMIVFDHNNHQIQECENLSKSMGFSRFHYRYTDRRDVAVLDKNSEFEYMIRAVNKDGSLKTPKAIDESRIMDHVFKVRRMEKALKNGTYIPFKVDESQIQPITKQGNCESLRDRSVYITSGWSVMPCCFLGAVIDAKTEDHRYDNFIRRIKEAGKDPNMYVCNETQTVKDIIDNHGLSWIYNQLPTNPLLACHLSCHDSARYKEMWNENTKVEFDRTNKD